VQIIRNDHGGEALTRERPAAGSSPIRLHERHAGITRTLSTAKTLQSRAAKTRMPARLRSRRRAPGGVTSCGRAPPFGRRLGAMQISSSSAQEKSSRPDCANEQPQRGEALPCAEAPSEWVVRWAQLVTPRPGARRRERRPGGMRVSSAARGLQVFAVDNVPQLIAGVAFVQADLESCQRWPFAGQRFAAWSLRIICTAAVGAARAVGR